MKKLICLLLCLGMLTAFVGCEREDGNRDRSRNPVTENSIDVTKNDGTKEEDPDQTGGDVTEPVTEPAPKGEPTFSLSGQHTTYLDENGNLYVWGSNIRYQLGYGGTKEKPTPYCILTDVAKVCAMPFITAALKTNGDLYIMGINSRGQAGCGDSENACEPQLLLSDVKDFAHNGNNGAAITNDGSLYIWGSDGFTRTPEKLLDNVETLRIGAHAMGAITAEGTLYVWTSGGAANAQDVSEISMEDYKVMEDVVDAYLCENSIAAIKKDGALYVSGGFVPGEMDVDKKLLEDVQQVSLGRDALLAIDGSGVVYGYGDFSRDVSFFKPAKIFEGGKAVYLGDGFGMFIADNGDLYSWGDNGSGQLGNGTTVAGLTPGKILENVQTVYIPMEDKSVAALTDDGTLYTWGSELTGMLGYVTNSEEACSVVPTEVLDHVDRLWFGAWPYGGNGAVAAICTDGAIYTWGYNTDGQTGNGNNDHQFTPWLLELT